MFNNGISRISYEEFAAFDLIDLIDLNSWSNTILLVKKNKTTKKISIILYKEISKKKYENNFS